MFPSHPRIRKRNSRVSVNDSINCSDHCFRSHNKDGACMETCPCILATEWLLAISISTSLHPGCQDWTWVLSHPRDPVRMSLKMVTSPQYLLCLHSASNQDNNDMRRVVQEKHQGSLSTFITSPASRQVAAPLVSQSPSPQY